ncbi:MAG: fimbria/pilus outer membrane usher protein [Pseudomonadota bacterium]|nr:fimbria/pilus outer membrane usher protein [Pseudomonadota bacterium]
MATSLTIGHAGAATGATLASLDAEPVDLTGAARAPQTLYLDIVLDGRVVAALVRFNLDGERLSVAPEALEAAGLLLPPQLPRDPQGRVALRDIPGLQVDYRPTQQQVELMPDLSLRPTRELGYSAPDPVEVQRDHGLALDWDAYGRSYDRATSLSVGTGARWFGRLGTLEASGVSRAGDGGTRAYARLDTRWTYSDPRRLWTWSAGDVISGGLGWTRPVRLGGVQWRRDFGVRPDMIVYPLPRFSGDAAVPSSVELFVNNVRQSGSQVAPGPFVLSDFPRVVGAGQAVVVVTDALGRSTQASVPLYVDYQRLARGLSDFSLEAGLLRRGFGVDSADYGQQVVGSGSYRRGLSDSFTLEMHGEGSGGLRLAGAGLAWSPLGRHGVVTASHARSEGAGRGRQSAVGYQWFGPRAGFDMQVQRASSGYRDLGALEAGQPPLRARDRATGWLQIPRGSVSLTWLRYQDRQQEPSRLVSLGLSQSFSLAAVSASAFHDQRAGRGLSLTVTVPLGRDLFASASADRRRGEGSVNAGIRRSAPYAGGWGWQVQARDDGDGQVSTAYRGRMGEAEIGLDRLGGRHGAFAQASGSIVVMDGRAFASRRISDAFAVVSTNGVGDVPILYENRVAGRTNAAGYLLLSDLRGWQRNRIAIDPDGLAADVQVPAIERTVTPANASGIRVAFGLERRRSAIVLLQDAQGAAVAAGTRVTRAGGRDAPVGFDGRLWLEDYAEGETLQWWRGGRDCNATVPSGLARRSAAPATVRAACSEGTVP